MIGYIIRRCLVAIIVVIGIALVTFLLLHGIQSSPVYAVLGTHASPQTVAAWNHQNGYDRPLFTQFFTYLGHLVTGHLGYSYKLNQSVDALFKENAGRTAYLSGAALVLSLLIAMPLGIFQAVKRNSVADYAITTLTFTLYAMPAFFLGLILIQFFALDIPVFPPSVSSNIQTTWGAITHPRDMFLPIITLTAINVAGYSRYQRSAALDQLAADYIRLARAKGLRERSVLFRHLLRNACLPMITLVGLSIPNLIAGNVLIEVLFNYPGLGLLFYNALGNGDYEVMLAYTIFGGVLVVLGNLMADVAVTVADPRIRYD